MQQFEPAFDFAAIQANTVCAAEQCSESNLSITFNAMIWQAA